MRKLNKEYLYAGGFLIILLALSALLIAQGDVRPVVASDGSQPTAPVVTAPVGRANQKLVAQPTASIRVTSAAVPAQSNPAMSRNSSLIPSSSKNVGIPAIKKQVQAGANVSNTSSTKITEADVRQHYKEINDIYAKTNKTPLTIEKIEFLSRQEASSKLHYTVDVTDDVTLCLVTLRGKFDASIPPSSEQDIGKVYSYSKEFQLFDANTGNLLMDGEMK